MSHTVAIKTHLTDSAAITAACQRLKLPSPVQGKAMLFAGEVSGTIIRLPDWHYPIAVDTASGDVRYDNYRGAWGDQKELDRFLQAYTVEKVRIEARRNGHLCSENQLQDGFVKLSIEEG